MQEKDSTKPFGVGLLEQLPDNILAVLSQAKLDTKQPVSDMQHDSHTAPLRRPTVVAESAIPVADISRVEKDGAAFWAAYSFNFL